MMESSEFIQIGNRRIALTSCLSWQQLKYSDTPVCEKLTVIALLKTYPELTSRKISELSNIERTSVTRALRQLEDEKIIVASSVKECPTTKKAVRWYSLANRSIDNTKTLFD